MPIQDQHSPDDSIAVAFNQLYADAANELDLADIKVWRNDLLDKVEQAKQITLAALLRVYLMRVAQLGGRILDILGAIFD